MSLQTIKRHNIAGAAAILMVAMVLSRFSGYFRQMLIPMRFGIGDLSDAYFLGFQIPDLMFQLLVGGSIQAALTPFLAGSIERGEESKGWRSVSIFMNYTLLLMVVAVVVGELSIGWLLPLIAGQRSAMVIALSTAVSRILFPSVVYIMLAGLCIGVLNAYRRFGASAWGPTLYNLGCIASLLVFARPDPSSVVRTSGGILISATAYFVLQFVLARREFSHHVASLDAKDEGFRRIVRTAIPTILSASIVQVNLIVLSAFANRFDSGSVSSMNLAITVWQLPYGVFAVAVGSAMLPSLSARFAAKDHGEFRRMLTGSLRGALFLTIPSALFIFLMREDIIRGLFQWNTMMPEGSVLRTSSVLAFYCMAIISHTFVFLLNMTFYSMGRTRIPLLAGIFSLVSNAALCYVFTKATRLGVSGMSLAYSLSSILSAALLFHLLRSRSPRNAPFGILPFLVRTGLATCAGGAVLVLLGLIPVVSDTKTIQLAWLAFRIILGFAAFLGITAILKMPEFFRSIDRIRRLIVAKSP